MVEVAIVTGGASGIGAALGSALVRRGAHVVLADVDGDAVEHNAKVFNEAGRGSAESAVVDVRDAQAVADLVHETHRSRGRLDLMFNNAGIGVAGEPEDLLLEHWDRAIDVNLRGVVHGCHAAYPLMKHQGSGHIVNTASLAGLVPSPGWLAPYSMTKFAVVGLSLALRAAGADDGIHVSVVCPGFVDTPILDTRGPGDLPVPESVAKRPTLRKMLETQKLRPYPVERLADDVLRGVARNKPVIVAPMAARLQWNVWRISPPVTLRAAQTWTRAARQRRRSGLLQSA